MRGRTVGAFFNICVCCLFFLCFPQVTGGPRRSPEGYRFNWRLHTGACNEVPAQNFIRFLGVICFVVFDCLLLLLLLLLIIFFFLLFLDIFLGAPEVTGGIRVVSDSTEGAVFCEALSPP